ncbi:hypothetical protein E2C01_042705 [Portunus trituberculatus]|uniref:Uncharacterized protein n=1 Tax=Portunus trituberculatus TaxID=210409 RepID=A0A5B7FUB6_PORTR|nr:hypothetical protein [Portunus trituberculatus]
MDGNLIHQLEPMSLCLNEAFSPNSIFIKHARFQQKCECNITATLSQALDIKDLTIQLIATLTQCHLAVRSNSKFMIITKHINTLTVMATGGKRSSYTISYKLHVMDYAKEHGFGPPPTEKIVTVWRQQED